MKEGRKTEENEQDFNYISLEKNIKKSMKKKKKHWTEKKS